MNRNRKSGSLGTVLSLVVLGGILGVAYLAFDNFRNSGGFTPVSTLPQLVPTAGPTDTPVPTLATTVTTTDALIATTLYIPTAGIYASVVEVFLDGTSWDIHNLGMNAGHLEGTAWLDTPGNIVLSGHVELADGRMGVFATIDELEIGNLLMLQHGSEERRYTVREVKRVQPDDLTVLYPTTTEQLTLITCDSYDFFQNAYLERIVVIADRIES
jgi:LPXTG-site transpeptidase (sortase) family protein